MGTVSLIIELHAEDIAEFLKRNGIANIKLNLPKSEPISKSNGGARQGIQEVLLDFLKLHKQEGATTAVLKALLSQSGYSPNSLNNQLHLMQKNGLVMTSKKGLYHAKG
jgi:hypothetical protein